MPREIKRITNVGDTKASVIITDCVECGKNIELPLIHPEEEDLLVYQECCGFIYALEHIIDLVVYKKEE